MQIEDHRPTTISGMKRMAQRIKKAEGITQAAALNKVASQLGYPHWPALLGELAVKPLPRHHLIISISWRDRESRERGREIIRIPLSRSRDEVIAQHYYRHTRNLGGMICTGEDVIAGNGAENRDHARQRAVEVARTFQFADITRLQPSGARRRFYPRGNYSNTAPSYDHPTYWYDPAARQHIVADQPYSENLMPKREVWASEWNWSVAKPRWSAMYRAEGGCSLYLMTDARQDYSLERLCEALEQGPPAVLLTDWDQIALSEEV